MGSFKNLNGEKVRQILAILFFCFLSLNARAQCTTAVTIKDSIGAATYDLIKRASENAAEEKCQSILVRINTPGGHLQSTRLITEHILASQIPFLCLISPVGGHAGSAGAIILQACHVAGGLTATNVGAATPVLGTGQETPEDLRNKMINDTVSWVKGMTELRGRNVDFSKKIVTEGLAVTIEDAVKMKAMDLVSLSETEFLEKAANREVLGPEKKKMKVEVGPLKEFALDIRYQILQFISEPEWAYMLFLGALLLLYAEFSHPGLFVPGVTGAILLILSMIAFHKLEASYGAMLLMLLGLVFWIAELFITSKGILGVAGTISFLLGSFLLFDRETSGYFIPLKLILSAGLVFGGLSALLTFLAARTLSLPKHDYDEQMKFSDVKILEVESGGRSGKAKSLGEIWNFESVEPLQIQDVVEIVSRKDLKLVLKKKDSRST